MYTQAHTYILVSYLHLLSHLMETFMTLKTEKHTCGSFSFCLKSLLENFDWLTEFSSWLTDFSSFLSRLNILSVYNYFKLIPKTKPNMILNSLPIYAKLTLCHWAIHLDQAFTSPTLRVFILKSEIISSLLIHYYILVITIIMNVKWQNGQVTKLLLKF